MSARFLEPLDWVILAAYFVILMAIGIWASMKRKKDSSLFMADHSLSWHHIGFSMWGTNVGPSMLIASASAGFTTGVVSGNYAWYAFVFICLLAFVFAPRYLGAKVTTLPEFMGRRFGQSTRNILAWYTIVTILISWLALTLFAGGILIRQIFEIPMWQSALILLLISAFFTIAGGLKAVAYTNVFQMVLLIVVSAILTGVGLVKVGGPEGLAAAVPADYWNLFRPNDDPAFPWLPILLGYPVMGVWFWCTDQSMVQPVLAAKSLKQGQLGANLTGWLKILDVPLYIIPGIICFALFPTLQNPDEAYMTMVTNLFPIGMVGLVMAVLTAALVSTVGSALNALSTVFTIDIYLKKYRPKNVRAYTVTLLKNFIMQRIPLAEEDDAEAVKSPASSAVSSPEASGEDLKRWSEFMQVLADSVTATEYNTWLRFMGFVSFTEEKLTVSVPTLFVKEFIESNFIEAVKNAVSVTYGDNVGLFYTIKE